MGPAGLASASRSPAACDANDFILQVGVNVSPPYNQGQLISYRVRAGNAEDPTASGCDVSGVTLTLTTPDGVVHTVQTGGSYPFPTAVADIGSTVLYTVNFAHAVAGPCGDKNSCPMIVTTAKATGLLHDSPAQDDPFTFSKQLSTPLSSINKVEHIIVAIQENRSADHYFGKLSTQGQPAYEAEPNTGNPNPLGGGKILPFHKPNLCETGDTNHSWNGAHQQWNHGHMNGSAKTNSIKASKNDPDPLPVDLQDPSSSRAMGYYDQTDLPFYYNLYKTFATSDRFFSSLLAGTQPNRFYLYAATSFGHIKNLSPVESAQVIANGGFPQPTIFGKFENAGISWKYYYGGNAAPGFPGTAAFLFTDVPAAKLVPIADYYTDLANGTLPQVSFIDPTFTDSAPTIITNNPPNVATDEHPPSNIQVAQKYMYNLLGALWQSSAWPTSALFLTYDEWGGYYDHVPPPKAVKPDGIKPIDEPRNVAGQFDRFGVRIPTVVVSPFAKSNFVSHDVHDHTSILKFIETRFNLFPLTQRDKAAQPMLEMFDFANAPSLTVPTSLLAPAPTVKPCAVLNGMRYGQTLSGNPFIQSNLSAKAWAGDPSLPLNVTKVEFVLSGVGVIATRTSPDIISTDNNTYSALWNTTTVANGTYTLYVVATDSAGNTGQSAPIQIIVKN